MGDTVAVFPTLEELSHAAARAVVAAAGAAIAQRGRFTLVLAGGRTPKALYQLLAGDYRAQIDWSKVYLFWGDERYVPHNDPQSNTRMAREALIGHVPVPAEQVFPMETGYGNPETAARAYESALSAAFRGARPDFDLVLLGMGADGHTASLFPGTGAERVQDRWVIPVRANVAPPLRLSLTLPLLTGARQALFLVTGEDKRSVLQAVLTDAQAGERYPAALVHAAGHAHWYVDAAANPL